MSSQVTIIARLKHTWTTVAMHDMDECGDILQVSYEPCIRYERIHGTVQEPLVGRLEMRCTMTSEAWPILAVYSQATRPLVEANMNVERWSDVYLWPTYLIMYFKL